MYRWFHRFKEVWMERSIASCPPIVIYFFLIPWTPLWLSYRRSFIVSCRSPRSIRALDTRYPSIYRLLSFPPMWLCLWPRRALSIVTFEAFVPLFLRLKIYFIVLTIFYAFSRNSPMGPVAHCGWHLRFMRLDPTIHHGDLNESYRILL